MIYPELDITGINKILRKSPLILHVNGELSSYWPLSTALVPRTKSPYYVHITYIITHIIAILRAFYTSRLNHGQMNVAYGAIHTLVRLADLVLTLATFSFNGKYQYSQTGGVAMGSRLGPNCAFLFMDHIEEQIFDHYTRRTPDL